MWPQPAVSRYNVDSNFLDPLELDASSHLGVPGLIAVLRKSGVVVANMPGSGVLEARALLGFLPSLCRRLLGETLIMPHIAIRPKSFILSNTASSTAPPTFSKWPSMPLSVALFSAPYNDFGSA